MRPLLGLLLFLAVGSAHATPAAKVGMLGCGAGVHVASAGTPLSALLRQMAAVMRFELHYWADDDPVVALDVRRHPHEVMRELSLSANMIVVYRDRGRCRGRADVKTVWVLPRGATSPQAASPLPAAKARASNAPTSPRGGPAVELDDSTREYMVLHGLLQDDAPGANGR